MTQTIQKRSFRNLLQGILMLSHPGPQIFLLVGLTIFTLLAGWPHLLWSTVLLILGAHMAMQAAIATFNDYCDRKLDAVSKPYRAIPSGLVTPREAVIIGCCMIVLMFILLKPLPRLAGLFCLLYLILGLAYDLRLKSTPLSGVVFALAIPLIPLYAFAGVEHNAPFLIWLVPTGFLLGVALNLANSLPDLEDDATAGLNTLAVALGVKRAFFTADTLLIVCTLMILLLDLLGIQKMQPLVLSITMLLVGISLGTIFLLTGPGKPISARKRYFQLVTLTCIILASGWLIGALT